MKCIESIVRRAARFLYWTGAICILFMVGHIGVDVFARVVIGHPTVGMVETVTNYYMVAACFLPLGYVQYRREMLMVEAFTHSLPARWVRMVDVFALGVSAAIAVALTWHSAVQAIARTERGEFLDITVMDLPIWPARWLLVLGYGAVLLVLVLQILLLLSGRNLAEAEAAQE